MSDKVGQLSVYIRGDNQLTPELNNASASLKSFGSTNKNVGDVASYNTKLTTRSFGQMTTAIRGLAMGVGFLGSTFIGLGSSMKNSNDETVRGIGNAAMMAGTIMSAVASSFQFVEAIGKIIKALNTMTKAEIMAQAFSGVGIATIIAGAAVAGVTIAGVTAVSKASNETAGSKSPTVNIYNAGSMVTQNQMVEQVRQGIIAGQRTTGTSGIK